MSPVSVIAAQRNSFRMWLLWPLAFGAMAVGLGVAEAALALNNDALGLALFIVIPAAYILGGLYVLERVGSRFVWSMTMVNSAPHMLRTISYPFGLYVIILDGNEVLRGRSWKLINRVGFQFGDNPAHHAKLRFSNYRWPIRLSLEVDGQRLTEL